LASLRRGRAADLAEATTRKALKRKPGFATRWSISPSRRREEERLDEACPLYERACHRAGVPKLATNLTRIYDQRGETAQTCRALGEERRPPGRARPAKCEADPAKPSVARCAQRSPNTTGSSRAARLAHLLLSTAQWAERICPATHSRPAPDRVAAALAAALDGKSVLLRGEQASATCFLSRFAPLLHRGGARPRLRASASPR
jgi:hypothetical protein